MSNAEPQIETCHICGASGLPERLATHDCASWVGVEATIDVQIDEAEYHQLRQAFKEAVANGYDEPFAVFVVNHCDGDYRVTAT